MLSYIYVACLCPRALVLLGCVLVASPALVSPAVACIWLLPCDTTGSGAVGRGLQPEDAVVGFARSCGSVCNKPPTHAPETTEGGQQDNEVLQEFDAITGGQQANEALNGFDAIA